MQGKILTTREGAIHGMKSRKDISRCIVMEAGSGDRPNDLSDYRPDVIAASSALMSLTS